MTPLGIVVLWSLFCAAKGSGEDFEIVYPERLHHTRHKRDLSTATENGHEHHVAYSVKAFNNEWIIDSRINDRLIPAKLIVRTAQEDGSELISEVIPEHCHYQGSLRGIEDSTVALETCNGLIGVIDDGKETYHIEPHSTYQDTGAHKIQLASRIKSSNDMPFQCGVEDHNHPVVDMRDDVVHNGNQPITKREYGQSTKMTNVKDIYVPYLTTNETRYNEVIFTVDKEIFQHYKNDTKTMIRRVMTLTNTLDRIYQQINIRIVMKAIDIWSNGVDQFSRKVGDFKLFGEYVNGVLRPKIPHDNAHFLSHHGWPGFLGLAWVGTMCGSGSFAINAWNFGNTIGPYITVGHEMGHNFNFGHAYGGGGCKCLSPKGCMMNFWPRPKILGFTNCSLNSLAGINDKCLHNVPTKMVGATCGNGIREGDEECDCGTPEVCKAKDPCCLPHDCRLKPSSMCSDLHHSCCQDCQFKKQGTLCRATQTDCDVPEYCPGDNKNCPADVVQQDGIPCNRTEKFILGNTNGRTAILRKISPIEARYVRINPQQWYKWICARTEFYGSSPDEAQPTAATPLKPYNGYCIVPESETCNPDDSTKLIFRSESYRCKHKYMGFRLDGNGTFWHVCSNKRVCPEHGGNYNGEKLMISSSCKDEDSKFVRTAAKSLKHVKSGKCVHPVGYWPGNGRYLNLWDGCDVQRLEIWFIRQDGIDPFGVQDGTIPDSQLSASSFRYKNEGPEYGRLHGNGYWCAKENNKKQYLQVDFGKTMRITMLGIQGRGTYWYDYVTGFYLYYSQDGQRWLPYTESGDVHSNSYCYLGKCAETRATQCRDLWGPKTDAGAVQCWDKLNTDAEGYGTCDAMKNTSCSAQDVMCGQIQCLSQADRPMVAYGKSYTKISLGDSVECSGAVLKHSDEVGLGMVRDGTKCGDQKMCVKAKCKTFDELKIKTCPTVNGKLCSGRGVCTDADKCFCYGGYDPDTACSKPYVPIDGGFSKWTDWSRCDVGCNGGTQYRHRQCSNPFPKHGGKDCHGDKLEKRSCNTDPCPKVLSCRYLQTFGLKKDKRYPDGIYPIYPKGLAKQPIKAYCDMSRDGGGWTLLMTSRTNTWTSNNTLLRNQDSPSLSHDYSFLKYADGIKNELNIGGNTAEYRLEAENRGHWGGIWQFPREYTFTARSNKQTDVKLLKKFDDWEYKNDGIEKRMPWIKDAKVTTSGDAYSAAWGTIASDDKNYHPAPWISGHLQERNPDVIWYWMREGPWQIPRSCMEIQTRAYMTYLRPNGVYTIQPPGKQPVKTYCDLTSRGGGWTLLVTSKTHKGWTADNVKSRNPDKPSLTNDYSILGVADHIKDFDTAQDFFQYRIEADGTNQYGGIFDAPRGYTFLSTSDKQTKVKLVENFNNISKAANIASRMPRLGMNSEVYLSTGSSGNDASGSIVYNDGSNGSPSYLPSMKDKPSVVRYWMREGTRRSCFDIKVHGVRNSQKDGYYFIRLINDSSYLPVYCDMTSDPGAYTLVVTSRHNKWTRDQVPARNIYFPSLNDDYSILKYADRIKDLSNNNTFKYKMDANTRNHWGGVWTAPKKYSFMKTSPSQTNVQMVTKFSNWEFSWWRGVKNRMPWFNLHGSDNKALLTTSKSTTSYPSGSIIWGDTERFPAYWIRYNGMMDPGVIWYWVNEDDCDSDRKPVHGGLSKWGEWSPCQESSGKMIQRRHKTCTNPLPRCGGKKCDMDAGKTVEEKDCFVFKGAISCRHLLSVAKTKNVNLPDGVYVIYPNGLSNQPIKAYCDMTRDGGGWTLLVSRHTSTWTENDVTLRNADTPSLTNDYSMLKYANAIKDNLNVIGDTFEYRLEAQERGRWGGIWQASRKYTFTSKRNNQTMVKLTKKFDDWDYTNTGIEQRMPWIGGHGRLTTSASEYDQWWGTITTVRNKHFKQSPWIYNKINDPEHIWYWMREGAWQPTRSCMEIQLRQLRSGLPVKDGVYTIHPNGKPPVKTYCDLTSRGGGWTLLVTSKTHKGWTADNVKSRNPDKPSLTNDYSILGVADPIKDFDPSQEFFQYRIEADGLTKYGGIFDAPRDYSFTSSSDKQTNIKIVENFGGISKNTNLAVRMPKMGVNADILLGSSATTSDGLGSLVYNDGSGSIASYLPSLKKPGVVRYWMREGARRSCFDQKVYGEKYSQSYEDSYYMIRLINESSYLPVYCDMTSDPGAYTLVVTSRHNNWTRDQVPARNIYRPSLDDDYSILKYADKIKDLNNNKTFKYQLDANRRGHWGGVWSAPKEYTFMSTSRSQTNVKMLKKFSNWEYQWWRSVHNRMPWFNLYEGEGKKALLTTSNYVNYYPSGSIIWGGTDRFPAYWIRYNGMMDPGVIWYWVNEDDCDSDRKPVDGGFSQWSSWSRCDSVCKEGKQRRTRQCDNPLPRCGGKQCEGHEEQKSCYTPCPDWKVLFDFENGIKDWKMTGSAFRNQPTYGDNTNARNTGSSKMKGDWFIGTYENRPSKTVAAGANQSDKPKGTITSPAFIIKGDKIRFLIGGGCDINLVRAELEIDGKVVEKTTGKCIEPMESHVWNVGSYMGKTAYVRLVDNSSGSWGHVNADHFEMFCTQAC